MRQRWADVAKGACIVLVVLWHVTRKDYLLLPWDPSLGALDWWDRLNTALLPVRMPLFFFVSGIFATRLLARPWREVLLGRVLPLLYVYVLWTLVHTVLLRVLVPDFPTAVASSVGELVGQLTTEPGNLWFLPALAAYAVVARACRARLGAAVVVAFVATVLVSVAVGAGDITTSDNRYLVYVHLVWFLLGARLRGVSWLPRWAGPFVVVGFVVAASWSLDQTFRDQHELRPFLALLGVACGVAVATWLAAVPRVGDGLAAVGQRTLAVYVMHLPLVAVAGLVTKRVVTGSLADSGLVAALYPVVLTALVVAACLALRRLLEPVAWVLFEAPWRRRVGSQPTPRWSRKAA